MRLQEAPEAKGGGWGWGMMRKGIGGGDSPYGEREGVQREGDTDKDIHNDREGEGKMKLKLLIAAGVLSIFAHCGTVTAHGSAITTRDLVDDYLEYEQGPPEDAFLINTTAYCHGEVCSHGAKPREGIAAGRPEWYGFAAVVYRAEKSRYNGYVQGELIGIFEILDTGYGKSTGDGIPSKVRADKQSRGTIEMGQCLDIYKPTYDKAKEWMELTGGKCFVQIVEDAKG